MRLRGIHLVGHHLVDPLLLLLLPILADVQVSGLHIIVIHNFSVHEICVQLVLALQFDPLDHLGLAIFLHEFAIYVPFFLLDFLYDPYDVPVVVDYFIIDFYLFVIGSVPALELGSLLLFSPFSLLAFAVALLIYFLELLTLLLLSQGDQSLFLCQGFLP